MNIIWNSTLFETLSLLFIFRITVFEIETDKDKEFDGELYIPEVFIVDVDDDSDSGDVLYLYSVQNKGKLKRIWMW